LLGGREEGGKGYKWDERGRVEGLQTRKVGGKEVLPMGRRDRRDGFIRKWCKEKDGK